MTPLGSTTYIRPSMPASIPLGPEREREGVIGTGVEVEGTDDRKLRALVVERDAELVELFGALSGGGPLAGLSAAEAGDEERVLFVGNGRTDRRAPDRPRRNAKFVERFVEHQRLDAAFVFGAEIDGHVDRHTVDFEIDRAHFEALLEMEREDRRARTVERRKLEREDAIAARSRGEAERHHLRTPHAAHSIRDR
jgi:hypothetical protein